MATYAKDTQVSPERSRAEIEQTLARYGARAFSYGYDEHRAVVMFDAGGRKVRFDLPIPAVKDFAYTAPGGRVWAPGARARTPAQRRTAQEKAVRQRWRALALVIKAKLEAVEAGVVTFEEEFLAHVLLPSGETVGEWATPQLAETYATGDMPPVLPGGERRLLEAGDPS